MKSWLTAVVVGLGVVLGPMATPAQAASICNQQNQTPKAYMCLWINGVGNNRYVVHVGIDVHGLTLAQAQEYIDDPGDPFVVAAITRNDRVLFTIPLVGLGASAESGLSGDFEIEVPGSALNENTQGADSVRARVWLIDRDTNQVIQIYKSEPIAGVWS
ncbi:hypothetical protein [Actinoplanes sp. NPDC026670]|uniref:hypothetical protein n=1 Tax=Actinoplanes sp. NPDC026670 TaxID=3154700 RepID=UPI00340AA659